MPRIFPLLLLAALAHSALAEEPGHAARMTASQKLFTSTVRGILKEHCVRCHGGDKTKSGLDLVTREAVLRGGDQGVAILPGKPEASLLYRAVAHLEEELAMPPKKPQLPADAIAALEEWIALGAAYDQPLLARSKTEKAPMQVTDEDRRYWAYAPLMATVPPPAQNNASSEIDRYLAVRHREHGLTA
ncbi:MAG: c-type cytochrome domain-containing protein, partial [Verrucomicrobiota bacterium]|nr:c-type cytochrome domain-containing protein [Verrucomicrobiota bacterium]